MIHAGIYYIYNVIQYRGIVVKDCYADFDRHHIGLVTQSQVSTSLLLSWDYWWFSFTVVSLVLLRSVKMMLDYWLKG